MSVGKLLAALEKCGIRRSDRRLTDFMAYLRERQAEEGQIVLGSNVESLLLDFETFDKLVETNLVLFDTVFNKRLVIPDFQVTYQHSYHFTLNISMPDPLLFNAF